MSRAGNNIQQELLHDRDTERAVLATMMRYYDQMAKYSGELSDDLFYYDLEKAMYRTIAGVTEAGFVPNVNALCDWTRSHDTGYDLQRGDFAELAALPSRTTIRQDIARLANMSRRRTLWLMYQTAARNVLDPSTDIDAAVNDTVEQLTGAQAGKDSGIASMRDSLEELRAVVRGNAEGKHTSLPTGFPLFDDHYILRPGTLTVLAAFTSVGKTALALNIAKAVAAQNYPVAYYSLEMGKAELAARLIAEDMRTPSSTILNKKLDPTLMAEFEKAAALNENRPIYIDERSTVSFDNTIRSIRTLAVSKGVRLVVIDYLQIYTQTTDNVEAALAAMARQAKNIAMETKTAVLLLSQLNRSEDHPSIKMLRGSGQIEESADNIVLIDRPEAYPDNKVDKYAGEFKEESTKGTAKFILAKGRGVGTGSDLVFFNGEMTRFTPRKKTQQQLEEEEFMKEHDEPLPF